MRVHSVSLFRGTAKNDYEVEILLPLLASCCAIHVVAVGDPVLAEARGCFNREERGVRYARVFSRNIRARVDRKASQCGAMGQRGIVLLIEASQALNLWYLNHTPDDSMLRKRSRLEMMHIILELAQQGILKTHIMYRANLSYEQLTKFLNILLTRHLLQEDDGQYVTTARGHEFVETFHEIQVILGERHSAHLPPM
jgi:predicted transcriptional regulator